MSRFATPEELAELRHYFNVIRRRKVYNDATCKGKSRFESRAMAVSTISFHKRKEIHAYHCPDCKGWHIGSRANGDGKRKAFRRILTKRREQCE